MTATGAMAERAAIEFADVSHSYRPRLGAAVVALSGFDLRVAAGTVCGLVGPNGSGKSTALKLAAGLAVPGGGRVLVAGHPATSREARRCTGYLPEGPGRPDWLTVAEFLRVCGELSGLAGATLGRAVQQQLVRAGLEREAGRSAAALSTGQRQRLGLAQALLASPAVVLLDEPAAGLDPVGVAELAGLLRQLRRAGTAVLLTSHFLRQVDTACDQVVLLDRGRVLWAGAGNGTVPLEQRYLELAGGPRWEEAGAR